MDPTAIADRWLDAFARAVRERDYDAGRALFARDVSAFGSVLARADGIDALVDGQWRVVWETTAGFTFVGERRVFGEHPITVAVAFSSTSLEGAERRGRATYVLVHDRDWRCVHSHHSLVPR